MSCTKKPSIRHYHSKHSKKSLTTSWGENITRINLIDPKYLTDQHLVAEYREILRAIGAASKNYNPSKPDQIPKEYVLGHGHVKFFYDKIAYLVRRHEMLRFEGTKRGFNLRQTPQTSHFGPSQMLDYTPDWRAYFKIYRRLATKIYTKPRWYRYYGHHMTNDAWDQLLSEIRNQYQI